MTAEYAFESLQSYPIYLWGGVTDCVAGCVNEKGQWGLHWDESDLLTKVVAAAVDVAAVGGSDDDDDVDDLGCLKGRKEIFSFVGWKLGSFGSTFYNSIIKRQLRLTYFWY